MKFTKGIRKQLFAKAYLKTFCESLYLQQDSKAGYITIRDILNGDEKPQDIMQKVEDYLDVYCSNGHFSRWTSHGLSIYDDAILMVNNLHMIYDQYTK